MQYRAWPARAASQCEAGPRDGSGRYADAGQGCNACSISMRRSRPPTGIFRIDRAQVVQGVVRVSRKQLDLGATQTCARAELPELSITWLAMSIASGSRCPASIAAKVSATSNDSAQSHAHGVRERRPAPRLTRAAPRPGC